MPSGHQYFFACRYSLSQGKIWPHRTIHLTKLPQGKKSIPDHIRTGLFIDLNTDALHFQTDRGRMESCALSEFWDRAHYPRYSTIRGNFQIVAIYKDFKEISSDNVTTILESPATDSPFSVLQNFPFAGRTISRSNPGYACSQSPVKAQRTVRS